MVVERTVAQCHGGQLRVLPPCEVIVVKACPVKEFLLVRSPEYDHRTDLDQFACRNRPAGEYAPAAALCRTHIDDVGGEDCPLRPRTQCSSTICRGITAPPCANESSGCCPGKKDAGRREFRQTYPGGSEDRGVSERICIRTPPQTYLEEQTIEDVIVARDLEKRFEDLVAVDHIAFRVRKGEVFGFLGPNGAGKTTTMKMIQCISPKTGGTLEVFGMDVNTHQREIKSRLGVVPQETNLDPDFSTYRNLLVYARYFGIPKQEAEQRAENLLAFMQLEEKRDVRVDKLSGGMKRRLIIARALINAPELLILDEPTIGLDPQARHLIWERLRNLQAEGNTLVLTTHYLDEAERLCDRLVIMDHGKILVEGPPADLIREHAGSDVVEVEQTPKVIARLTELGVNYDLVGDMLQVFTDRPHDVARELLEVCRHEAVTVRPATLEDVFLRLTGRRLRE
jgi:lipooligosaccharide transport system ATP-binding protein